MLNENAKLGDKTASEAFRAGQGTEALALANPIPNTSRGIALRYTHGTLALAVLHLVCFNAAQIVHITSGV